MSAITEMEIVLCVGGSEDGRRITTTTDVVRLACSDASYIRQHIGVRGNSFSVFVPESDAEFSVESVINKLIAGYHRQIDKVRLI